MQTTYAVYRAKTFPNYPTLSEWPTPGLAGADAIERSVDGHTYVVERDNGHGLTIMAEYRDGELRLDRPHRAKAGG